MNPVSLRMELHAGDITKLDVDGIVNAANSSLMGGGGVDGAIHRAGGPRILEECKSIRDRLGDCPVGEAVITGGGNLKARFVIHAVGPVWQGGTKNEEQLLRSAYQNALLRASENKLGSLAFPNISTGIFGYPKRQAAHIALNAITDFLEQSAWPEKIIFCCFDEENIRLYNSLLLK